MIIFVHWFKEKINGPILYQKNYTLHPNIICPISLAKKLAQRIWRRRFLNKDDGQCKTDEKPKY